MLRQNTASVEKEATSLKHEFFNELKLRKGSMKEVKFNSEYEGQTEKQTNKHKTYARRNA